MTTNPPSEIADPIGFARRIALTQLDRAPRTRAQLERALDARHVPQDVAAVVLDRLTEVGLVDDEAYARMLVRSRTVTRGLARRALRAELRHKGCGDEAISAALADVTDEDERQRAAELVVRHSRRMAGLDAVVRRRRLAGMLARKGYSPEVIAVTLTGLAGPST